MFDLLALIDANWLKSLVNDLVRLGVAVLLGGLVGFERQVHGRWVGMRTHMAVSMGAAIFTIAALAVAPGPLPDATRVIQGIAAGVGFLGAGTILKLSDQLEIKGLTTASSIWLAAALGTTAGLEKYDLAIAATIVSLGVLALLRPLEKWVEDRKEVGS
jgi:putative Mg2+ transporter-C (MgtC) family protein